MKLSPKIKDIFDIIRAISSYIAILIFCFALYFTYSVNDIKVEEISEYLILFGKIIAVLLVFLPFILLFIDWIRLKYIIYKGNLSGYIIERHQLIIDIRDKHGRNATIYQKISFHKFSNKIKEQYLSNLTVSGTIVASSIQTQNCFYSLNLDQKGLNLSYVNNMKKLNKVTNFFKENDKFLIFYATLKDTFLNNEESWDIDVHNLCQDYNLQILLPKKRTIKDVKFFKIGEINTIVEGIQPIIITKKKRQKIELQVMNFDKNDKYRVTWTLN